MERGAVATAEERLRELGLVLPAPPISLGQFVQATRWGDLLFTAGHFGTDGDRILTGKVGADLDAEAAREAARSAALNLLATLRAELGTLDAVRRVLRVYGVVNATPDFMGHTHVVNAASDVLVDVFGDAGRHARLAVGVSSLPGNLVLEIEATIAVDPDAGGTP